jgi:hypothetical protein
MLSDAQIERYSRQILLPEVGGRGQARLLAARAAVAGSGSAARAAATLLGRAGIGILTLSDGPGTLPELSADCRVERTPNLAAAPVADVTVDLAGDPTETAALGRRAQAAGKPFVLGRVSGGAVAVVTLIGRPCAACLRDGHPPGRGTSPGAGGLAPAADLALGALAAGEALRALLLPPGGGRRTTLALDAGTYGISPLSPTEGCALCGGTA